MQANDRPEAFWRTFEGTPFNEKYYLKRFLGEGQFGGVFAADEVLADRHIREVAIKIFNPLRPIAIDELVQELQQVMALKHSHLIDCYSPEQGKLGGTIPAFALVMELGGASLDRRLPAQVLSVAEARSLVQDLAQALVFLHDRRVVHRDLKPANILAVGSAWKLADLGIMRALGDRSGTFTSGQPLGTLAYMPPESYDGGIFPVWDCWSLGVVITEALTGAHPFPAQIATQLMRQVMFEEPQFPSPLPEPFQTIVRGCLIKDHRQRWQAQQILAALAGRSVTIGPTTGGTQWASPTTRREWQERLPNGVILEMVEIPAGSFLMGSTSEDIDNVTRQTGTHDYEEWMKTECPQHRVNISAFAMGKYPITQEQYQAIIGTNPSHFSGLNRPVENVSCNDAQAFCQRLSQLTGKTYRLPSEAEWEYACRAGSQTLFSFGDRLSDLSKYGWYANNSGNQVIDSLKTWNDLGRDWRKYYDFLIKNGCKTQPVGQKQPNAFGLYDMHGNVWEWCEDVWHSNYQGAPTDGSAWVTGGDTDVRVIRGGSWNSLADACASGYRDNWGADNRDFYQGFRVVLLV